MLTKSRILLRQLTRDTADPSPNIMLKLMSVISLMLAPVIMHFGGLI